MIEAIGQTGSGLLAGILTLALLGLAVWLADRTLNWLTPRLSQRASDGQVNGCLALLALSAAWIAVLGILFYPSVTALQRHACKGADDFELCMSGDSE